MSDKDQSTHANVLDAIGALDEIEVFHNRILVGIYIRPKVTKGGVHLTDKTQAEDEYQGKVAVVLKKGPMAFVDDGSAHFFDQNVEPGDWIVYRTSDGFPIDINGVHCRLMEDTEVRLRVRQPEIIY